MDTPQKSCNHPQGGGCMWCCVQCDTDTHLCGGCGAQLSHGEYSCAGCSQLSRPPNTEGQPAPPQRDVRYY